MSNNKKVTAAALKKDKDLFEQEAANYISDVVREMKLGVSKKTTKDEEEEEDNEEEEDFGNVKAKRNYGLPHKIETIPFDGKDFQWKFRFVSLLMGYGLLNIVEGTETGKGIEFTKRRDFAYSMLVMSMTDITLKFAMNAKRGDANTV